MRGRGLSPAFLILRKQKSCFEPPYPLRDRISYLQVSAHYGTLVLSFALVLSPARLTRLRSEAHQETLMITLAFAWHQKRKEDDI